MEKTKRKRRRKRTNKRIIVLIIIVLVLITGQRYYKQSLEAVDQNNPENIEIVIPAHSSTTNIADILYEKGLIKSPFIFKYRSKTKFSGNSLKAGGYNLSTEMTLDEIIENITKGGLDTNTTRFTIPEGYEVGQVADKLSKEGIVDKDKFLELVSDKHNFQDDYPFLKELDDSQGLEGFLYPSTYEIFENTTEEEIISKMLVEFQKIYEEELRPKMQELDMDLNEIVTLASIIEREGKVDKERPIMSAVFYNRMEQGMMLQSCATVQYILGERKEVLTNEDTKIPSPYNTYINEGLPPAPIASPGKVSLISAVNPADVDYLFFVLTGADGTHTFTTNYDDHLNAKPKN